jgi:poly(hydroxyalkanoate) depolymerase family esterase
MQRKIMSQVKTLHDRIAAVTGLLTSKGPNVALAAIQEALKNGTLADIRTSNTASSFRPGGSVMSTPEFLVGQPEFVSKLLTQLGVCVPGVSDASATEEAIPCKGQFLSKSYANQAGSRRYKVYIPSTYAGQPMPLMVMLHGCTQNPDDFSAGTQMNTVAEEKQCFVVYPAQEQSANASKCWNWFKALDQQRGQGEPSIIAGITNAVITEYGLDRDKVYVAGMSAGGAMAVIMGSTYPDLYKAVGVHSGLPYAAANDLPSAMNAMRGAAAKRARFGAGSPAQAALAAIPIIVFHGDRDTTVSAANGDQLIDDFVRNFEQNNTGAAMQVLVEDGGKPGQRTYTRTSHHMGDQPALAEHWVIHGAGHAWAGGSARGSYTDAGGPDASREMLRFFYTQSPEPAPSLSQRVPGEMNSAPG